MVDFGANLTIATFSPTPEGYSPEETARLRQFAVEHFWSPMQQITGYGQNPGAVKLAADLGEPLQNAMTAYGALRMGTYAPAPEREVQWGAPMDDVYASPQNTASANVNARGSLNP